MGISLFLNSLPLQVLSDSEAAVIGLITVLVIIFIVYSVTKKFMETKGASQRAKSISGEIQKGFTKTEDKDEVDSLKILKNRLAKGEITTNEYEELKKTLEQC